MLDPACGSGHILVVAYDVLKAIYLERGYRLRDIPRLILEKNLYGLDIDDRAAQLAGFALLMKARADDRRLLADPENPPRLNILSLQESQGLDAQALHAALTAGHSPQASRRAPDAGFADTDLFPATRPQMTLGEAAALPAPGASTGLTQQAIAELIATFAHAKTFGSLIQIGPQRLPSLREQLSILKSAEASGDLYAQAAAKDLLPLVRQALVLGMQFDAVVANPPYMGGKGMNPALKAYAKDSFPDSKADLFAMFMERGFGWCKPSGFNSMVTMQSWMFLSSYEAMREKLLTQRTIQTMAHLGARAFGEISGEVVQTTAFVLQGQHFLGFKPVFFRLVEGQEAEKEAALRGNQNRFDATVQDDFKKIPGSPIAYWITESAINCFSGRHVSDLTISDGQNKTGDNGRFVRLWWEISCHDFGVGGKWLSYAKGGDFRRWFGNLDYVVDWSDAARSHYQKDFSARIIPEYLYYQIGVTWTLLTSAKQSFRLLPEYATFDMTGSSLFLKDVNNFNLLIAYLNSCVAEMYMKILNPTLALQVKDVKNLPLPVSDVVHKAGPITDELMAISESDWMQNETSFKFAQLWPRNSKEINNKLEHFLIERVDETKKSIFRMKYLEEENNRIFIDAFGLQDELSPEVPEDQITLARADREKDCQRLISYAIGCMMGRYSLDAPGLIYAHAGNVGFDPSRYPSFPADADGILPVTDQPWFADDAPTRIREFLHAVWGPNTLEENLAWLAESLGPKGSETPEETIRRYIAGQFFKDHLQTYKKRPIYWLFSSGKQGAFQALVYLHRYHEGTLARMRSEYVIPLTAKYAARLDLLSQDATAATSAAARTKINKQIETLRKQQAELLAFDEKLRHYADMRITLDLDDGVKVNYGKFGDLLAGVKVVTGGSGDD